MAETVRTVALLDVRTPPQFGVLLDFPLEETRYRVAGGLTLTFRVRPLGAQAVGVMGAFCRRPVAVAEVRDQPAADPTGGKRVRADTAAPADDRMLYTVDGFVRRFGLDLLEQILAEQPKPVAAAASRPEGGAGGG